MNLFNKKRLVEVLLIGKEQQTTMGNQEILVSVNTTQ